MSQTRIRAMWPLLCVVGMLGCADKGGPSKSAPPDARPTPPRPAPVDAAAPRPRPPRPATPRDAGAAKPVDPRAAAAARHCPSLLDRSGSIGPRTGPLNRKLEGLGTRALLATVRRQHRRWRRVDPVEIPAGHAGTWADSIRVRVQKDHYKLDLSVGDLIRICDCRPGTGAALLGYTARERAGFKSQTLRVGGQPVVVQVGGRYRSLHLIVGDRCRVTLDSRRRGLTTRLYLDALGILDLAALEKLCRKR